MFKKIKAQAWKKSVRIEKLLEKKKQTKNPHTLGKIYDKTKIYNNKKWNKTQTSKTHLQRAILKADEIHLKNESVRWKIGKNKRPRTKHSNKKMKNAEENEKDGGYC